MDQALPPTRPRGTGDLSPHGIFSKIGATSLRATIGSPSDPAADMDLFLVRPNGSLGGQSADGDSEESVSLVKPAAGVYTVVVDGYSVPSGSTTYDYRDVYFSGALGSLTVPATPVTLAAGKTLPVTGSVTATAAPQAGRNLFGQVSIVTDQGAVIGRGSVLIGAVG